jgi:phage baseplate assembly protein W
MSIKIKSLEVSNLVKTSITSSFLYKDLCLDLDPVIFRNDQLHRGEILRDVSALYDVEAVKNSIKTLFLTAPGDKLLSPEYGMDLRRYLFEPIDEYILDVIKDDIVTQMPIMEPRVEVTGVEVTGDVEDHTINITLQINIPSLNIYGLILKSTLNSSGYNIA